MKPKIIVHLISIALVSIIAFSIIFAVDKGKAIERKSAVAGIKGMPDLSFVDFSNPFQKALALDAMNIYFPGNFDANSANVTAAANAQEKAFRDKLQHSNNDERLTWSRWWGILAMYGKFFAVYVVVMLLTYYGVQTMGVWRFCRKKSKGTQRHRGPVDAAVNAAKNALLIAGSFVLFCPAYVIAYSLRTELNTDTVFFMVFLCVISNGLLMVYANKFYAFLTSESRKGYVDTAIVKNLRNAYNRTRPGGISLKAICTPFKRFEGHVFDHIFRNARHQYLSTMKEQASFLITGMIVTEMALNLHGYLSYELLRQMLYGNLDIVIVLLLGIFFTVKATEIFTDYLVYKEVMKYENT
jgi:hypothetical protein